MIGSPNHYFSFLFILTSVQVEDLMSGRLFSRRRAPEELAADKNQLARIVALLGPPPQLLSDSSSRAIVFFNKEGSAKAEVPNETVETVLVLPLERVGRTMTASESEAFLALIR